MPSARREVIVSAVALMGVVPLVALVQWSDMVVGGTMMAGPFPPLGACLFWAVLLAINFGVGRLTSRTLLRREELLLILSVWVVANMVAGRGLLHPLLSSLVGTSYYARSGVLSRAVPEYLPDWLAVTNPHAVRDFFEGHGVAVPWAFWWRPLATWSLFFLPFLTANLCLVALFERVWIQNERLAFPLVELPLELLDTRISNRGVGGSGHRIGPRPHMNRQVFALGMAFPLLLHGFGAVHAYLPGVPCIPFFNDLSSFVTDPPWLVLRPLYLNLYPLLIGLTFLAPADMTLSIWFFLILNKLEMLLTATSGWNDGATGNSGTSSLPFLEEQSAGAFLALAALFIWNARQHLGTVGRGMFFKSSASPDALLGWGFLLGVVGVLAWCVWTGIPLWFAMAFFGFYLAVALVLSRLMAEGGVSWILAPILPDKLIFSLVGSGSVTPLVLTRLPLQVQHLRDTRQMFGPALMQTGRLREAVGVRTGRFYALMLSAVVLALVVGVATALPQFYQHGALSMAPNSDGLMMSSSVIPLTGVNQASDRLQHVLKPSAGSASALVLGGAITVLLSVLRTRFLWWPLHPLGYALTGTLQLGYANKMLFSIFLGWAFKTLTLRFGGVRGFRLLRNAALGLILGDLLMGGILKLLDWLLGPSGYAIF